MLQILGFRAPGKANLPGTFGPHCRDLVPTFCAGCFLKSTVPAFSSFSEPSPELWRMSVRFSRISLCRRRSGSAKLLQTSLAAGCAMTTKLFDNQICTFKIILSWRFPRKTAFWTIFLSAPKAPPPLKNRKFYFRDSRYFTNTILFEIITFLI